MESAKTRSSSVISDEDWSSSSKELARKTCPNEVQKRHFEDDLPSFRKEMAPETCPNEVEKCHFSGGGLKSTRRFVVEVSFSGRSIFLLHGNDN